MKTSRAIAVAALLVLASLRVFAADAAQSAVPGEEDTPASQEIVGPRSETA